jgi:hypothetical protein
VLFRKGVQRFFCAKSKGKNIESYTDLGTGTSFSWGSQWFQKKQKNVEVFEITEKNSSSSGIAKKMRKNQTSSTTTI